MVNACWFLQEAELPAEVIQKAKDMLHNLTMVIPDQPPASSVASFLAESDNVTRILKGYSDTLDGGPSAQNKQAPLLLNKQTAQVRLQDCHMCKTACRGFPHDLSADWICQT